MGKADRLVLSNIHILGTAGFCLGHVLPTPIRTSNDFLLGKQILCVFGSNSDVARVLLRENRFLNRSYMCIAVGCGSVGRLAFLAWANVFVIPLSSLLHRTGKLLCHVFIHYPDREQHCVS